MNTVHHTALSDGDEIPIHDEILETEQANYSTRPILHIWYTK
jgi:hypothetical protein